MAFGWIDEQAGARRRAGLVRTLRPRPADSPLLDLASNDYLGLARHPEITEGAAAAARKWGGGATGSRLVTGTTELHGELERELADFCGFESALVFSSGYAANLAAVTALAPHGSLVVSDAGNHASLIDGCRLARGTTQVVAHTDPDAVRKALGTHKGPAVAVSDAVFSVDGDAAPLADLAAACREFEAGLIVDDAHGLGVLGDGGRGAPQAAGLAGASDVVVTVTLSKSLGSQGGAVLGPQPVVDHLVNRARPFIFDTGLAPASAAGALAALGVLRDSPDLPHVVRHRVTDLAAALGVEPPSGAVLSVPMESPQVALAAQAAVLAKGVRVGCFRPPSVPDGISRLRITSSAGPSEADWARATDVLVEVVKEFRA
jgi:8-amino-7-oxononanoate synthase